MVDLLSTRWFAVDWGTSHMRVYAMDADDDVIARGTGPGMGEIAAGAGSRSKAFEEALLSALSRMMETDAVQTRDLPPVVMCGMVGSRQGWQEAGYLSTPQSLDTLHEKVIRVDTRHSGLQDVHIVPGISQSDPPDVMRGEETQLAGFVGQEAQFGLVSGRVCLPGTHSKWAVLERGTLRGFTTYLTGELFDLLSKRSILAHSVGSKTMDRDVFYETVRACAKGKLNLSEALFSIRAKGLLTGEDAAAARGRLSGLLI
ncbi:MAG: 2-dehydro-3-deoxygalactonokinase, partial [Pseudomonadota bacterium]